LPPRLSPIEYKKLKSEVTNSIFQSCTSPMKVTFH